MRPKRACAATPLLHPFQNSSMACYTPHSAQGWRSGFAGCLSEERYSGCPWSQVSGCDNATYGRSSSAEEWPSFLLLHDYCDSSPVNKDTRTRVRCPGSCTIHPSSNIARSRHSLPKNGGSGQARLAWLAHRELRIRTPYRKTGKKKGQETSPAQHCLRRRTDELQWRISHPAATLVPAGAPLAHRSDALHRGISEGFGARVACVLSFGNRLGAGRNAAAEWQKPKGFSSLPRAVDNRTWAL